MNFYNSLIETTENITGVLSKTEYPYNPDNSWNDVGHNELVLLKECAFELGGGDNFAVGFNLVTSGCIGENKIIVIGDDLNSITSDTNFARISFIEINDIADEQEAYNAIRKIEYVKYHYFPEGYMVRTSSKNSKEQVRVNKTAVKNGLTFEKIGNMLIRQYNESGSVRAVKIFFITDKSADYKTLETIAIKSNEITETLNHVMNNLKFDCNSCNLKPVCDEVDGMKELHFKSSMAM